MNHEDYISEDRIRRRWRIPVMLGKVLGFLYLTAATVFILGGLYGCAMNLGMKP